MTLLTGGRIRHGVVFSLAHPAGSDAEAAFLDALRRLASIPGVEAFELLREVSPKNDFAYALTMEFAGRDAYAAYDGHPDHVAFVAERWDSEVAAFMELDAAAL